MKLNDYEKQHLEILRKQLAECTVLLKTNGDFPLEKAGQVALYGSGARHTIKGGTGSGEVNSRYFVTVEQGLKDAGFTITTTDWMDAYDNLLVDAKKEFHKVIKARAKKNHTMAVIEGMGAVMPEPEYELPLTGAGDVAVYVLSRISGEGSDREPVAGDILLGKTEIHDILALKAKYPKFMLVLNVGGAVDLSPVAEVENILLLSQLGVETGAVLADILLGKAAPSGKLTTTWSAWADYPSMGEFGDINDTRYNEGIYIGYRYFDSVGKKALFPFGYGQSFTRFEITGQNAAPEYPHDDTMTAQTKAGTKTGQVQTDTTTKQPQIRVTATVKNVGNRDGKEVVQLYVSSPEGRLDQPYQALAAWAKTKNLKPGETEDVTMTFSLADLASYDAENAQYLLEKGDYVLRIGNSSVDTFPCAIARLDADVVTMKTKNCCGKPDFADWKPEQKVQASMPENLPVLELCANDFATAMAAYDKEHEIDPEVGIFTNEQLALMNTGAFDPKGSLSSIIGSASKTVAGAAGETANATGARDFPVMVMADGPAGLRLTREYFIDAKGVHGIGAGMPESIAEFMPKPAVWLMSLMEKKPKSGDAIHEQYATAIPIGTALAQSWNLDLAKDCGDIVGDEMERFEVHLWLAPALNIHRSIRCGRNFEYFSEDPLVSGKFAAAITLGVQAHAGCGTTIKHYAANNQETNRYNNNSQVSERAMREIYLKGFGICVRESQPHAVMTSYNLLNGTHTSEHRGLIEDILRSEYGYEGIVMTDWIVNGGTMNKASIHPAPNAAKIAAAGGDLVMPGGKGDYENILKALQEGTLDKKQVQINATRVYRMAKKLAL